MAGDTHDGGKPPVRPSEGAGTGPCAASGSRADPASTSARGAGRELALAVMCALESYAADDVQGRADATRLTLAHPPRGDADGESAFCELVASTPSRVFAEELLALWSSRSGEVDALIERVSLRWRLARMDAIDRNLLRLAATELSARPGTPRGVVLAESVRLARRYGSERSARFVNGVVESLAQQLRPKSATTQAPSTKPASDAEDASVEDAGSDGSKDNR